MANALSSDPAELREEVLELRGIIEKNAQAIAEKERVLAEKTQRIEQLLDYILLLRKRQFGASADRPSRNQLHLFDEAELEQLLADLGLPDSIEAEKVPREKGDSERKPPVRRPLPANLCSSDEDRREKT